MKKIAFLSNINIEPLQHRFEKENHYEIYVSGYNQWHSELLNTDSKLSSFNPDFIFIYLNNDDKNFNINDLISSIHSFSDINNKCQFIIANIANQPFSVHTYHDQTAIETDEINKKLSDFVSENEHILIFDFNRIIAFHGYNTLFDDKYWYLGRIKFSNFGFNVLYLELNNFLNCIQGKSKKLLILDADNTIWGGVAGEDGWQNLQIGNEGTDRVFHDFQNSILELKKQGILLALCSKNNVEDVREVFENNKNMLLKWDDFVAHCINWKSKSENIIQLALDLNIGTNAMVFIDDNPIERAIVSTEISEIVVPEFPKDITLLNRWFINDVVYPHFSKINTTNEDIDKTSQYQRNEQRKTIKQSMNYDEFLQSLYIKLEINRADKNNYRRISQLTQKTNQFNLSLKRYTEIEILNLIENPNYLIYSIHYEDKFGIEGIVGCAIVKISNTNAKIDSFMLSCRVLGRKIEFSFIDYIVNQLKNKGFKEMNLQYNASERNGIFKTFLENYGCNTNDNILYTKILTD